MQRHRVARLKRLSRSRPNALSDGYATVPREPSKAMLASWFGTQQFHIEHSFQAVDIVRRKLRRVIKAGSR